MKNAVAPLTAQIYLKVILGCDAAANMLKSGLESLGACKSVSTRSDEGHVCAPTDVSADIEPENHRENSFNNSELAESPREAIDLIDTFESRKEIQNHFSGNDDTLIARTATTSFS